MLWGREKSLHLPHISSQFLCRTAHSVVRMLLRTTSNVMDNVYITVALGTYSTFRVICSSTLGVLFMKKQTYLCGFWCWDPYLIEGSTLCGQHITFNSSIGLLCWLYNSGPEDLLPTLQLRGSSGIQTSSRYWGELGPKSMGSLWEESFVSL